MNICKYICIYILDEEVEEQFEICINLTSLWKSSKYQRAHIPATLVPLWKISVYVLRVSTTSLVELAFVKSYK